MANALFLATPLFMVRTPLFPVEVFERITFSLDFRKELLTLYQQSPILREAIFIASPDLYKALKKGNEVDDQTISSLLKYVLRMSTRATPFGLFSAVSIGYVDKATKGDIDLSKLKRMARPDMEWLMRVLESICSNEISILSFKIKKNPLLVKSMGRILLSYTRLKKEISIQESPLVSMILDRTAEFIDVRQLISDLKQEVPHLDEVKLLQLLRNLLKEEILYPSIFPHLLTTSPFHTLIENLKASRCNDNKPILEYLESVSSFLQDYNHIGGDLLFQEIDTKMRTIASSPTVLQVDSVINSTVKLSLEVVEEITKAAEALWRLSFAPTGIPHLRDYHLHFLEKWGTFRIIPLLDLIDENIGLGYPKEYAQVEIGPAKENMSPEWQQFLTWKWMRCIQGESKEILITDDDIKKFGISSAKESAPASLDIYCEVTASSSENIDKGNYLVVLQPIVAGGDGMATFGRFLHLFNERDLQIIQSVLHTQEMNEDDQIFVETTYFPSSARSANVAIHPNLRKWNINLGYGESKQAIDLEDIYVGATHENLFLSLKNGQKLNFLSMNVLNPTLGPKIVRFLREISKDQYHLLHPFPWGNLQNAVYLPRVRYHKTILSSAKWRLTEALLEVQEKDSIQEACKKIDQWADHQKIPVKIFLMFADHRILLDRKQGFQLQEIARHLKSNKEVILTEDVGEVGWTQSLLGTHRSEFVVPILKNKKYALKTSSGTPFQPISHSQRWQAIGIEWVYLKLYLKELGKDIFLKKYLPHLIETVDPYLWHWFFIQYNDKEGSHLRLRFQYKEKNLLPVLSNWADELMESRVIREYSFHAYEREVERYGGPLVIEAAEAFFHADSEVVLKMLCYKTTLPNYIIAVLSILDMLQSFEISIPNQMHLFESMKLNKDELEGFRSWKAILLPYARQILEKIDASNELETLMQLFVQRHEAQKNYLACLRTIPSISLDGVIISLLHMHCNRFLGIDHRLEQKSYLFASHTLQTIFKSKAQIKVETTLAKISDDPTRMKSPLYCNDKKYLHL